MGIGFLTRFQISTLSLILLVTTGSIFIHVLTASSWTTIFSDQQDSKVQITDLKVVNSFPLDEQKVERVIQGDDLTGQILSVKVYDDDQLGLFVPKGERFEDQIIRLAPQNFAGKNLLNKTYATFVDLPYSSISHLTDPHLFFHMMHGEYEVYVNDRLIGRSNHLSSYISLKLMFDESETVRITWITKNRYNDKFIGFSFLHGISIRSAADAAWAQRTLPMQHELPRLIAAIAFCCFCLFALVLASSAPRYNDLWAFAAFTGSLFFLIWSKTPFYWEAYDFTSSEVLDYSVIWGAVHALVVLTAACLSLSFFRVRGYYLGLILGLTFIWCVYAVGHVWPYGSDLPMYKIYAAVDGELVKTMLASQVIIFAYGFYTLLDQKRQFRRRGLMAMVSLMRRRSIEAGLFLSAMGLMVGTYLIALPLQSVTSGPDLFLLFALAPATVIFIQFYWMMGASHRFREKLMPQMDYLDYLLLELKDQALQERYDGVLGAFDLKGYKALTALKAKSPQHGAAVGALLKTIQKDIAGLMTPGQTMFRYKSNGDEWLFALYAKDPEQAKAVLKVVTGRWFGAAAGLMAKWKDSFAASLGEGFDDHCQQVMEHFDIHVMFCTLHDMAINIEDGQSRPDYTCDSFTLLTPAFKDATYNRVAMYESEAAALIVGGEQKLEFVPLSGGQQGVGFMAVGEARHSATEQRHLVSEQRHSEAEDVQRTA